MRYILFIIAAVWTIATCDAQISLGRIFADAAKSLTIATCNAQIRLDSIFADVAKIEKDMMKPYYQNAIDYTLKGRRRLNVAKYFRFNTSNDTVYIMDMYYGKGDCLTYMWSSQDRISYGSSYLYSAIFDLTKADKWKRKGKILHQMVKLIEEWNIPELKRIGVKVPTHNEPHIYILIARVIINKSRYSIETSSFYNDGFYKNNAI